MHFESNHFDRLVNVYHWCFTRVVFLSLRVTVLHPLPPGTAVSATKTLGKCSVSESVSSTIDFSLKLETYAASLFVHTNN